MASMYDLTTTFESSASSTRRWSVLQVSDFFAKSEDMFAEMNWQKKLRNNPALFGVSSHMSLWSNLIFYSSLLINAIGRPSAKSFARETISGKYIK
jgi:hypothetical protein